MHVGGQNTQPPTPAPAHPPDMTGVHTCMTQPYCILNRGSDAHARQNNWKTASKITQAISTYTEQLGISKERSYDLYKKHGTCLKVWRMHVQTAKSMINIFEYNEVLND